MTRTRPASEVSQQPPAPDRDLNRAPDHATTRVSESFRTGHTFRTPALLDIALTHSSLLHEDPAMRSGTPAQPPPDNEQLEFLGDAVLSLVVAERLFRSFPLAREGDLTRLRASVVSSKHLAAIAVSLNLGAHLRLGRGEDRSGGRRKPALLADALEAVIAALYLDGGLLAAATFVEREIVSPALPELRQALAQGAAIGDYKSALQERLQATRVGQPRYVLTDESGPDHKRLFRVAVQIQAADGSSIALAESEGPTKKHAQQEAARLALLHLDRRSPDSGVRDQSSPEKTP